ncbi:uncharacterized protein ABDE67_013070 [Symphorus nematophorus]
MDPLDFLEDEELLRFFHRHKNEMSCMENPQVFINQLRDHDLIPEERYMKVSRMKSKDNKRRALYDMLDCLERRQSEDIKEFWRSVFKDVTINQYPTLQTLRKSLLDGSFHFDIQPLERVEKKETDERKRKKLIEDEEGEEKRENSTKKKRTLRRKSVCNDDDEEQAGPSPLTPGQKKKSKKISFSSPLKKGEKGNIWTWPLYKSQLPVTCGKRKGILMRHKLAKGEKCIVVDKRWFTPAEFERFAGKESSRNWKWTIRCMDTPLLKLIEEGHLKAERYKGGCKTPKKSLFPTDRVLTVEEEEEEAEEPTEQQPEASQDKSKKVFKVTCGALAGTLHEKRFASGTCGKSIRTETGWLSPVEFLKEASCPPDALWRKDIKWEGKPLSVLTEAETLKLHSLLCTCRLCKPDSTELENQKNDDECCICKSEEEEELVVCDQCPRSFHPKCHLPHIEDAILGDGSLWMCTFCVFRSNAECFYMDEVRREAAMSRQISQNILQCQYLFLSLCTADEEQTFATNPSLYLTDYSTVIKTPMWLGEVADRLQKQLYQTVGEFVSDVQLIFTNCASYNRENAEFLAIGNRLKNLFDEEFNNVFNIHE